MENIRFESVDPFDLSKKDFERIHEVMQDMWASEAWMWELAQCHTCGKMVSKEEAFHYVPREIMEKTVAEIVRICGNSDIECPDCWGDTRYVYGTENIQKIRRRLLWSVDSFLTLCISDTDGIVGFEEAYVDSIDRMFELDLADHYWSVGIHEVKRRVEWILWYVPKECLLTSSLGLIGPYQNFQNLFWIMSTFSHSLPDDYVGLPWLSELSRGGVTHRMSDWIGHGISLGIEDDPVLRSKMRNVGKSFQCDLVLFPDSIRMHKDNFTHWIRHFLRQTKREKWITSHRESSWMYSSTSVLETSAQLA